MPIKVFHLPAVCNMISKSEQHSTETGPLPKITYININQNIHNKK
jgi:hypothetical protein